LLFVPSLDARFIPPSDAIFATACSTADTLLGYGETKGEKFYLIQGYETWMWPKEYVDMTWRLPVHKIVVSKWLFDLGKKLGSTDMVYVPNAIDHNKYKCTRPVEGRPVQIAMLSSAVAIKGCRDGVQSLEIARKRFPSIRVILFGTGRRQSFIPPWMEYYRNPPQEFIVNEIYNKSRIIVSPSWSEGFALPPAEAASCGCAIVATDSGGIRDFVENGVTGLLSPPKDPEALAENICLLLGNDDLRVRLANACKSNVARFTWEHSGNLMEELLTNVVQRREIELSRKHSSAV
jgi:glycosyltransferase involved in cell wall biosynthesis